MSKKKTTNLPPEDVLERAKALADDWSWAIALQHDRITKPREQDRKFHPFQCDFFHEADVHFFIISLYRLRSVATTLEHVPELWANVKAAIDTFDRKIPWLKRMRDVFEHLEDYAVNSNRRRTNTSSSELPVWSASENGMNWLSDDIDWDLAVQAAYELDRSIRGGDGQGTDKVFGTKN